MKHLKWLSGVVISVALLSGCNQTEYVHVGPNWDALWKLEQQESNIKVTINTGNSYSLGEHMTFTVGSNRDGHLWVVQVDPNDEVSQLFPNEVMADNRIKANQKLTLPPSSASWAIEASEPLGESVLAFIVTQGDTDLQDVLDSKRGSMTKALRLVDESGVWGLSKTVIKIKE